MCSRSMSIPSSKSRVKYIIGRTVEKLFVFSTAAELMVLSISVSNRLYIYLYSLNSVGQPLPFGGVLSFM